MFKKIKSEDYTLQKVQDNIESEFLRINNGIFQDGIRKASVALVSGSDNKITHGLGRDYLGFIVINKNANADVWLSSTTNNFKKNQILLSASATVTVDLWIF